MMVCIGVMSACMHLQWLLYIAGHVGGSVSMENEYGRLNGVSSIIIIGKILYC